MLVKFENKVAGFVRREGLFGSAGKVLLAVSGGADSTALLYAMCALRAEGVFDSELICAHINHQLRGNEAELDEDFVIAQAGSLKLAITTRRVDVRGFARHNKLSIETAARKLRIEALLDIADANNCGLIATAHQKNDNAETLLQRLLRGTGFRGLGGIWPTRVFAGGVSFVRPLLSVTRDEIVEYLKQRNLKWRIDRTNADCRYKRNFVRHRLIPVMQQECSGSIIEQLSKLSESARKFYGLVHSRAKQGWAQLADCGGEEVKLDLEKFSNQPEPVKVELARRSLAYLGSGERDLTGEHYKKILQLAGRDVGGKRVELPGGFLARGEYGKLIFGRTEGGQRPKEQPGESKRIEVPGKARFGNYLVEATVLKVEDGVTGRDKIDSCLHRNDTAEKTNFVERFDLDKVKQPLEVRFRKDGDRFVPLGLAEGKRVGKFLTAAKVPQQLRQKLLIVADSEKIVWVWPIRISEQVKIRSGTRKILQLRITESGVTGDSVA